MTYSFSFTPRFNKGFKKYTKKDNRIKDKSLKKIEKICKNPELGKPLRNVLANKRRERVNGFVIIYEVKGNKIVFLIFEHHDYVYKN